MAKRNEKRREGLFINKRYDMVVCLLRFSSVTVFGKLVG